MNEEINEKESGSFQSMRIFLLLALFVICGQACMVIPNERMVEESTDDLFSPSLSSSDSASEPFEFGGKSPNIILIVADDLGYGDLGCYGQESIKTPNIDALATDGMKFTNFYAGSTVCAPSRCVLMTGKHTGHCEIRGNGPHAISPEAQTIAELLKSSDYTTACIGKWGLGLEGSQGVPTKQGFDNFFGYLHQGHAHNYYPTFLILNEQRIPLENVVPDERGSGAGVSSNKAQYSHDLFIESSLSFLDIYHTKPFFLYLPFTIPHANNEARNKGMEIPDYGSYEEEGWPDPQKGLAAMITHLDSGIGQIVSKLEELGISDDTIIMFTSDNGPHREGGNDPDFFDSNGALRGIKRDLYEGGIKVPLIVKWPGKIKKNSKSSHICGFQDIMPTLADFTGTRKEIQDNLDGISFAPLLFNDLTKQNYHPYLYWEFHEQGGKQAIRHGAWKGIFFKKTKKFELYNLSSDPLETKNISGLHLTKTIQLKRLMDSARTSSEIWN